MNLENMPKLGFGMMRLPEVDGRIDMEQVCEMVDAVVEKMLDMDQIPCTGCRYCCDGCPMKIKIPDVFRALNTARLYPEK